MKTFNLKYILSALFVFVLSLDFGAQAQAPALKTDVIAVSGNCDMCKTRIEKAAKVPGVVKADWNVDSKKLTLVYNPKKITLDAVEKKIAAVGHDTPKYKADKKTYDSLPACCRYRK